MAEETKRKKKSSNYVLEQMVETMGATITDATPIWREIKDEFISPKAALEYAETNKVKGVIRVVRLASPIYGGSVIQQEPVYTLKKIDSVETKEKQRKPRKPRKLATVATPTEPAVSMEPSDSDDGLDAAMEASLGDLDAGDQAAIPPTEGSDQDAIP